MPRISATPLVLDFETKTWLRREYRATFVRDRGTLCSYTDKLRIEAAEILCEGCFAARINGVFVTYRYPDVSPETWESDLANIFGDEMAASVAQDCDSPRCHSCRINLNGDALYVETLELPERLGISDDGSAVNPSKKRKTEVLKLYGHKCFRCGSKETLGIDHIVPKSRGGNADFENLQPLCRKCGNVKANQAPDNIVLVRESARD